MHSSERKADMVKAREKDVASIKMQGDEKLDKSIIYVGRWKGCIVEMLCWKNICKTAEKGLSEG